MVMIKITPIYCSTKAITTLGRGLYYSIHLFWYVIFISTDAETDVQDNTKFAQGHIMI